MNKLNITNITPFQIIINANGKKTIFPPYNKKSKSNTYTFKGEINNIPISKIESVIASLPEPKENTFYIVTNQQFETSDRTDLLTIQACIQNNTKQVKECKQLITKHDLNLDTKLHTRKIINFAGKNAYYSCSDCGIELYGKEVGIVAAGENYANGEFAPCPHCKKENSIDRDNKEEN